MHKEGNHSMKFFQIEDNAWVNLSQVTQLYINETPTETTVHFHMVGGDVVNVTVQDRKTLLKEISDLEGSKFLDMELHRSQQAQLKILKQLEGRTLMTPDNFRKLIIIMSK